MLRLHPYLNVSVLGRKEKRILTDKGLRFLNVDYSSTKLQNLFLKKGNIEIELRANPEDMGWIAVCIDGRWQIAKAIQSGMDNVSIQHWIETTRTLRNRFKEEAELSRDTVKRAYKRIMEKNEAARLRNQIEPWEISEKRLAQANEELFYGMHFEGEPEFEPHENGLFERIISAQSEDTGTKDPSSNDNSDTKEPSTPTPSTYLNWED